PHRALHTFPTRRSSDLKPQAEKIDKQTHAILAFVGNARRQEDAVGQNLSARVIVANVFSCEAARTSILFLHEGSFFAFRCAFTRSEEHTSELQSRENLV